MTESLRARDLLRSRQGWTVVGVTIALWGATGLLSRLTAVPGHSWGLIWLPIGFAAAALIRRFWLLLPIALGIVLSSTLGMLVLGAPARGPLEGTVSAAEAALIAWLVLRWRARLLARPRDALAFAAAAFLGVAAGATMWTILTVLLNPGGASPQVWTEWFLADMTGVVVVAPFALALPLRALPVREVLTTVSLAGVAAGLAGIAARWYAVPGVPGDYALVIGSSAAVLAILLAGLHVGLAAMGLAEIAAMLVAFGVGVSPDGLGFPHMQALAILVGLMLLLGGVAVRDEFERRSSSEWLARSMFHATPVPSARVQSVTKPADGELISLLVLEANAAWGDLLGLVDGDLNGQDLLRYVHPADLPLVRDALLSVHRRVDTEREVRLVRRAPSDHRLVVLTFVRISAPADGAWPRRPDDLIVVATDVTEQRREFDAALLAAATDDLTGLRNRRAIMSELAARLNGTSADWQAAIFLDLNGFKQINDRSGHLYGDQVLRAFADRLSKCVRPGDLIGRYGGDEFLVVCTLPPGTSPQVMIDRLAQELREPLVIAGLSVQVSATFGAALAEPGDTAERLIERADAAMYSRKPQAALES